MLKFDDKYRNYLTYFETNLVKTLDIHLNGVESYLANAIKYSILDGGKRIRPILCFATAEMLGTTVPEVLDYALAIECIHSYSLVHDDLPAMDNDNYRRGKLSTHKKFGEATAILAGDALLNLAFEIILSKQDFDSLDAKSLQLLSSCSGAQGMILGQALDLKNEKIKGNFNQTELFSIYENKTAKLIYAPLIMASVKSGYKYFEELKIYGYYLGLLFQIIDDIMDVEGTLESIGKTPHKDITEDKLTAIKVFGIEGAKRIAKKYYDECSQIIKKIPNNDFLLELTKKMYLRKK